MSLKKISIYLLAISIIVPNMCFAVCSTASETGEVEPEGCDEYADTNNDSMVTLAEARDQLLKDNLDTQLNSGSEEVAGLTFRDEIQKIATQIPPKLNKAKLF